MLALVKNCGMSDAQRDNEWGAQKRLFAATKEMRDALKMAEECSDVLRTEFSNAAQAFDAFVHDELPSEDLWDEKISEARQ
jgi:hypothetical protein